MAYKVTSAALVAALFVAAAPAVSAESGASYLDRFEGGWSGDGFVQRESDDEPRSVSCSFNSSRSGANTINLKGSCRAALIFTREVGAQIRYDAASDTFNGSWTGSKKGPAKLTSGVLKGNTLTLKVTYPNVVHGDRNAVMTISNRGNGSFQLFVTDKVGGQSKKTSNMTLTQG